MRTLNRVSISLCLILSLASCATETIVDRPVPVEVIRYERVPIPADLLVKHNKTAIPDGLTYAEAIELWSLDRAIIDTHNGQLDALRSLNNGD